ncbi:MAG: hypothetical protein QHG99_04525 [Methanomicrobiales archaeon]|nr:hypothetical protein [Methanomicrobiales archaeon]
MQKNTKFHTNKREREERSDELALLADISAFEGRYEEAEKLYIEALASADQNADLWAFRAINLSGGLGKWEEARKCWERAEKLDPEIREMTKGAAEVESSELMERPKLIRNIRCKSRSRGLLREIEKD